MRVVSEILLKPMVQLPDGAIVPKGTRGAALLPVDHYASRLDVEISGRTATVSIETPPNLVRGRREEDEAWVRRVLQDNMIEFIRSELFK